MDDAFKTICAQVPCASVVVETYTPFVLSASSSILVTLASTTIDRRIYTQGLGIGVEFKNKSWKPFQSATFAQSITGGIFGMGNLRSIGVDLSTAVTTYNSTITGVGNVGTFVYK